MIKAQSQISFNIESAIEIAILEHKHEIKLSYDSLTFRMENMVSGLKPSQTFPPSEPGLSETDCLQPSRVSVQDLSQPYLWMLGIEPGTFFMQRSGCTTELWQLPYSLYVG